MWISAADYRLDSFGCLRTFGVTPTLVSMASKRAAGASDAGPVVEDCSPFYASQLSPRVLALLLHAPI